MTLKQIHAGQIETVRDYSPQPNPQTFNAQGLYTLLPHGPLLFINSLVPLAWNLSLVSIFSPYQNQPTTSMP